MKKQETEKNSPQDKKQKFVEAAHALFLTKGYNKTSINDIINHAGVSKGGFYHHFSSKSELLDAFVESMFLEFHQFSNSSAESNQDLPAIQQWNEYMLGANQWKVQYKDQLLELMRVLHAEENLPLNQRITKKTLELIKPQFIYLIEKGVEQGVFDVEDAESCADVLCGVFVGFSDTFYDVVTSGESLKQNLEFITRRISAINQSMERILGAPTNSLKVVDTDTVIQWLS